MNERKTVFCIIGTRPEAIKMAPVVKALQASDWALCVVVLTAQHRELLDPMMNWFGIAADHDLNLMRAAQQPGELLARMLPALETLLRSESADIVLAQGDTATTFGAALAAFQTQVPFGHIEAGLRTHDLAHPFPEEGYRQMVSRISRWHFAPTERDAEALHAEGVPETNVHVTGNTGIDALLDTIKRLPSGAAAGQERTILLTAHRRESFGAPLRSVFATLREVVEDVPDVRVRYPVHPNPRVQEAARELLSGHPRIELVEPLDYVEFVAAMRDASLILTDSGGVQEEAPALGKPVLVLRETTERMNAIEQGHALLVGTDRSRLKQVLMDVLHYPGRMSELSRVGYPFGDGHAAARIISILGEGIQSVPFTSEASRSV